MYKHETGLVIRIIDVYKMQGMCGLPLEPLGYSLPSYLYLD